MKSEPVFRTSCGRIIDSLGRVRIFRGMNVGGNSKLPKSLSGQGASATDDVSFIGRPFSEDAADEHFAKLVSLGCTLIRWVITWEAVEHSGPGIYDEEYLAYLRRLFKKAETYGISIFIDPHQDVWSRWTGGDGAPAWTLRAVGMDISKLESCGAAFTRDGQKDAYKEMSWPLNYQRYACATLFTLFWGGDVFAPGFMIDGTPVQQYLQQHYIDAMYHVARRIKDCRAVIGFGIMNEPHSGYIGLQDLSVRDPRIIARGGVYMTPFAGMTAASGYGGECRPFTVGPTGLVTLGKNVVPPVSGGIFLRGYSCPWRNAGVWKIDTATGKPVLCRRDYFATAYGRSVDFLHDFLKPFQERFIKTLAKKHRDYLFFIDGTIHGEYPLWRCSVGNDIYQPSSVIEREGGVVSDSDEYGAQTVCSFHWYDGLTLASKKWNALFTMDPVSFKPAIGKAHVQKCFTEQLERVCCQGKKGGIPLFASETGVPFDLEKDSEYEKAEEALSMYYNSFDELLLSCTLWNYNPDNTSDDGDVWNGENLSVFSSESGIRAVKGFCRPYAMAVAGVPCRMSFSQDEGVFKFEWEASALSPQTQPEQGTVIFVPSCQYPYGWMVECFDGVGTITERPEEQRLYIITVCARRCFLRIVPKKDNYSK